MKLPCGRDPDLITKLHPAPCFLLLIKMAMFNLGGWGEEGDTLRKTEIMWQHGSGKKMCASYKTQVIILLELLIVQI